MKKWLKNLIWVAVLSITFLAGVFSGQTGLFPGLSPALAAPDYPEELAVFWEAWEIIQANFVDREVLDNPSKLTYSAIKALTEALGDTGHTRFLTPEEANDHSRAIQGDSFSGIGAYLGIDANGQPMIITPFENSPAKKAGLRAGDLLLEIDGADVTAWTISEIVGRTKGEKGTEVRITVRHRGSSEPETVIVIRDEIVIPAVEWAFIPDSKIAFIKLDQFSANAGYELEMAITAARDKGATGLVIDIRNNAGGLLSQAVEVTSQFVDRGNVLQRADAFGNRVPYAAKSGGLALDIPIVVLVNEVTASSAEIFAGAIQDHERGLIIGDVTFGTGTVLTPFTLSDGSVLLLGTGQWLTADGRTIRHQGIIPDVSVSLAEDGYMLFPSDMRYFTREELFHSKDTQLIEALDQLNNCWDKGSCE